MISPCCAERPLPLGRPLDDCGKENENIFFSSDNLALKSVHGDGFAVSDSMFVTTRPLELHFNSNWFHTTFIDLLALQKPSMTEVESRKPWFKISKSSILTPSEAVAIKLAWEVPSYSMSATGPKGETLFTLKVPPKNQYFPSFQFKVKTRTPFSVEYGPSFPAGAEVELRVDLRCSYWGYHVFIVPGNHLIAKVSPAKKHCSASPEKKSKVMDLTSDDISRLVDSAYNTAASEPRVKQKRRNWKREDQVLQIAPGVDASLIIAIIKGCSYGRGP
ncbi:hypothetical protein AB1Y20_023108 [Prymnesium parvum]|uniref:Uncharacterized protein n=1 Tax=Prymnesium parvum TaxID=97485 RepID=A0AB34JG35_PRYPA